MRKILFFTPLLIVFLAAPRTAAAAEECPTFSGRATVIQANVLGILPTVLSDTGGIDTTGGAKHASLLGGAVAGLLTAKDLHATVVAGGTNSRAEASLSNLSLSVAGNTIGADFIMARANASCASPSPTVRGFAEIDGLTVNGQNVFVTGVPNQVVSLLGGFFMILNEQTSSIDGTSASITVNALHVSGPGVDLVIGVDPAIGVTVNPNVSTGIPVHGPGCDFVTGGGTITTLTGSRGTFGVAGGINSNLNGWGHLEYHDHGMPGVNVHGTQVDSYAIDPLDPMHSRVITGETDFNGTSGFTYVVNVADNGEPGTGSDTFSIQVYDASNMQVYSSGPVPITLSGGNIQLHNKCAQ